MCLGLLTLLEHIDMAQGVRQAAQYQLPGEVFSSPVIIDNQILVGCRDDGLHCLRLVPS